jgi:hypothetical protein
MRMRISLRARQLSGSWVFLGDKTVPPCAGCRQSSF